MKQHKIGFLLALCLLASCSVLKNKGPQPQFAKISCYQRSAYTYSKADIPRPVHEIALDTLLTARFSTNSLNIANAIDILDLLTKFINKKKDIKADNSIENRLDLIEIHQKINQLIDFSSLEISAVSSEIDCEEERAAQVASYIENKQNNKETRLTVASIVLGAAGAVATGVLLADDREDNLSDIIGIASGVAEASLGVAILSNNPKIEFRHPRNVLRDIWNGNEISDIFPVSIWYYLNYSSPGKTSLRNQLLESWKSFGQIESTKKNSENESQPASLYFGDGGKYTADELKNRAHMYDQLESVIKLMKQDLKNLSSEIENLN